jgi:DNA-binding response OmpR family regulator
MPARILIVDDDPDLVELLRLALTEAGYSARTAATGTAALAEAQRFLPELVVLDLLLPDRNGFSVCENLRRNPATASVPIIMMTVLSGEFPRLVGAEAGANAYINKPFQTRELVSCVGDLLRGSSTKSDLANDPGRLAADPWRLVQDPPQPRLRVAMGKSSAR